MFLQKPHAGTQRVFSTFFLLAMIVVSGCIQVPTGPPIGGLPEKPLQRFQSYEELVKAFKDAQNNQRSYGLPEMAIGSPLSAPQTGAASDSTARTAVDYSTTNVQVEGVDEADIIKSDGKYIYNFSNNSDYVYDSSSPASLVITDAYPIETSSIVSKTSLLGVQPLEMFIFEDKLLLFGRKTSGWDYPMPLAEPSATVIDRPYYPYYSQAVSVQLYDISDRSFPVLEKEFEFQGNYLASRLIAQNAYFVIQNYPSYLVYSQTTEPAQAESIIPLMAEGVGGEMVAKRITEPTDIGYMPPMPVENFVTIVSLDFESKEMQKETIVGNAQTVFASLNNIYLAGTAWLSPETPVVGGVQRAIEGDNEKTLVSKFNLDSGKIAFVGQGSVPGHVLNQFSMDEFEGNFRVATTVGEVWNTREQSRNNLYVLGSEMKLIGALEGLAPGEKIYSARFMGPRAYMVTFKKVDPLFVIDVSDPSSPRVLGKLKIPGYSDYLHPIDETHIIGVGKETIEASDELVGQRGFGFAWYQGLKMAVFDVSDVENPVEMHKIVVGDRGTDSYALHDHKAFLYDKEKELLVLPIMLAEIPADQKTPLEENQRSPAYGTPVFQGAFVYRLTLENGFEERGRITHISPLEELNSGYYYSDDSQVKRAMFIENVLYTLSGKMLKANVLDTLAPLKEFVFAGFEEELPPTP